MRGGLHLMTRALSALAHRSHARYSCEAFTSQALRDYDAEGPYSRLIEDARRALRPAKKRKKLRE